MGGTGNPSRVQVDLPTSDKHQNPPFRRLSVSFQQVFRSQNGTLWDAFPTRCQKQEVPTCCRVQHEPGGGFWTPGTWSPPPGFPPRF